MESNKRTSVKVPRFHGKQGEDYALWRLRLRAARRVKGVWNVVSHTCTSSTATNGTLELPAESVRYQTKREKASGIIISALGDAPFGLFWM